MISLYIDTTVCSMFQLLFLFEEGQVLATGDASVRSHSVTLFGECGPTLRLPLSTGLSSLSLFCLVTRVPAVTLTKL
jgi:hypothetical protein